MSSVCSCCTCHSLHAGCPVYQRLFGDTLPTPCTRMPAARRSGAQERPLLNSGAAGFVLSRASLSLLAQAWQGDGGILREEVGCPLLRRVCERGRYNTAFSLSVLSYVQIAFFFCRIFPPPKSPLLLQGTETKRAILRGYLLVCLPVVRAFQGLTGSSPSEERAR